MTNPPYEAKASLRNEVQTLQIPLKWRNFRTGKMKKEKRKKKREEEEEEEAEEK